MTVYLRCSRHRDLRPRIPWGSCTSRRWGSCRDTWTLRGWIQVSLPLSMSLCPASSFFEDDFYTKVTFWFQISHAVHKIVVFYTIVKTIVVYPERCLYLYNNMCGNHNIRPAHFFFGNCSIQCRISMGNNIIIEESGKGGIILYQTPDGQTSLEVKLENETVSFSDAGPIPSMRFQRPPA